MSQDLNEFTPNPSYAEAFAFYKQFGICVEMFSWATTRQGYFSANMDEACHEYLQLKAEGIFNIPYG